MRGLGPSCSSNSRGSNSLASEVNGCSLELDAKVGFNEKRTGPDGASPPFLAGVERSSPGPVSSQNESAGLITEPAEARLTLSVSSTSRRQPRLLLRSRIYRRSIGDTSGLPTVFNTTLIPELARTAGRVFKSIHAACRTWARTFPSERSEVTSVC